MPSSGPGRLLEGALLALRRHWPEYLMEAAGLGLFMISACAFAALLEHPSSPVRAALPDPTVRRVLMGLAMGGTAVLLIYSPWGQQSGAHYNPSVTLAFFRLGKVEPWDAIFYAASQFVGGVAGVLLMAVLLGKAVSEPPVRYVATLPTAGRGIAFATEAVISFVLMTVVLAVSNKQRVARFTGLCAGALVAVNITLAAPLSGMSMNPARSFGSALPARLWEGLWIYFTAPPLGMLAAAQGWLWLRGRSGVSCAKLHHQNSRRCIFCQYRLARPGESSPASRATAPGRAARGP